MKKVLSILLTLCLVCMVFTAFAAEPTKKDEYEQHLEKLVTDMRSYFETTGQADKVASYDEPVTVTSVSQYGSSLQDAMTVFGDEYGESWNFTRYADAYKRMFNIDLEMKWWVNDTDYLQKMRLDMAANDLPDVFLVTNQQDLQQMIDADQICDLTDMYDTWQSDLNKEIDQSDGGCQLAMGTVNGRLYGLPIGVSDTDQFSYIWIRQDWLTKLNLAAPTTTDELKQVMDAFMAADFDGNGEADTIGMGIDKDLYYTTRGLFAAFGAYPEVWVNNDGTLQWGGVSDTEKAALSYLAELYKGNYLDREFITKANGDMMESALSGHCGVIYGGHWIAHTWGTMHDIDPEADWVCIELPTGTDKPVSQALKTCYRGWMVVRKGYANPEVVFKLAALNNFVFYDDDSSWWIYDKDISNGLAIGHINCSHMENLNAWHACLNAFESGNTDGMHYNAGAYWTNLHGDGAYAWEKMFGNGAGVAMTVLDNAKNDNRLFYDAFTGTQSTFMQDRWSTILDEQLIAYTKIILGDVSVDEGFAAWQDTFTKLGGDQITQEINEWNQNR